MKNNRVAFSCKRSSLSSRAHCCRRVPGTRPELGGQGGGRDQRGHTTLYPRAVTLGCCSKPSAFAARALKSLEHDFWREVRDAGCPRLGGGGAGVLE